MLVVLSLSLSAAVVETAPPKPEPIDLLSRSLEVTGGKRNHAGIVGMERTWDWSSGDATGTLQTNWTPTAYRSIMASSDGSWTMAWGEDEQGPWQIQHDGTSTKPDKVSALLQQMQADPAALLRHDRYVKRLATGALVKVFDRQVWRVLAAPKYGKVWTLFFDEENGKLVGSEYWKAGHDGKQAKVKATYGDWRSFGPIQMSYKTVETSANGESTLTLKDVQARPMQKADLTRLTKADLGGAGEAIAENAGGQSQSRGKYHAGLFKKLGPNLTMADGRTVSSDLVRSRPNVLLYFSAKWCPPCRAFTPKLVEFAKGNASDDFAVIFVSSDKTKEEMLKYMSSYGMPFQAIDFNSTGPVKQTWAGKGIPNLVWLGPDDKVIKGSYESDGKYTPQVPGSYIGPDKVLEAFKRR
jgi:nucleoredoxin